MSWMNEFEVEEALVRFNQGQTPILGMGALVLARLANWTNRNSDGWPYWVKPSRAATKLMDMLQAHRFNYTDDISLAELRKACSPIKSFLTRQGVDHGVVFGSDTI